MPAFVHRETVRFGHVDAAGIAYYPRIHEWISNTVESWFTHGLDAPWPHLHLERRLGTPIVESRTQFRRAMRLGEELELALVVEDIGRHTFDLAVTITGVADHEERVRAWVRHIIVRLDPLRAEPIPDWLRGSMERYRANAPAGAAADASAP